MRSLLLVLLAVVVGLVLIAVPLLVVQRAECRQGDRFEDQWSVSSPFDQERRRGCREPTSGAEELLEFVRGR